jgi:hypothetical protein
MPAWPYIDAAARKRLDGNARGRGGDQIELVGAGGRCGDKGKPERQGEGQEGEAEGGGAGRDGAQWLSISSKPREG